MEEKATADIPESYFEYRAEFTVPMFGVWTLPNPLVSSLFLALKGWGIGLGDITWNKEPSSYNDFQITINVLKLNAQIKFGLDSTTFIATNPDWSGAKELMELFKAAMDVIQKAATAGISSQDVALAMHVRTGEKSSKQTMSAFVNADLLGPAQMYGISVYKEDSWFVVDKSVRYPDCFFVRLQRRHGASASFDDIARRLYEDELKVLQMLGLGNLLEG